MNIEKKAEEKELELERPGKREIMRKSDKTKGHMFPEEMIICTDYL